MPFAATIGLIAVVMLSLGLRFWHLGQFNDLVFDEVYYVKFAQAYLSQTAIFDAHPPLGKYLIAVGIWLGEHGLGEYIPFNFSAVKTADVGLSSFSYRWMNALVGSLIPIVVIGVSQSLDSRRLLLKKWIFSLLAGLFVAIDGLFITESRYALINIYMVFFGLLSHYLWLQSAHVKGQSKALFRLSSGLALGASVAVKWNGLGYFLSLLVWEVWRERVDRRKQFAVLLTRFAGLGLMALLTYGLIWWPHLHLAQDSLVTVHQKLLTFHGELDATHPACAKWYTWPLLIKPISYWYVENKSAQPGTLVQAVNNLGNPALWGLSAATVLVLLVEWRRILRPDSDAIAPLKSYLLIGYLTNWLPWILVERCTYNYLFMPAAVFGFMALALAMSEWLCGQSSLYRVAAGIMLIGIAIAFLYWLPLSLGLPLTPQALQNRWWLRSWI
ncbi:phospholipid carrier-dependent glycosyltransferase [cf. Phormidesmis sp. LEGE 11477]|uniref:phospholipid carrier-dependent glycosyltransferase n=1 Tax=cf. Phormidesmis sp. LEGE 11477 TaxID=1828680 RepID=UPI0018806885|nr:phospholipid carrier-dependent glycosyltransferase [cf. Phormidesmis sp. LEGE 11477]MBE9062799.1 phospholipid carrier-dependent glycosyltransferase [cf. Phormidesmis sp. LEGE 11477]